MDRTIPDASWAALARALVVAEAALRAVAAVESSGSGFLPPPDDRPKVLFEGHAFHNLTGGRFSQSHPTPEAIPPGRAGDSCRHARRRMAAAGCRRGPRPAGRTSVRQLGRISNHGLQLRPLRLPRRRGVRRLARNPAAGTSSMRLRSFISRDVFLRALRRRNWAEFARHYNGPRTENKYDSEARRGLRPLQPGRRPSAQAPPRSRGPKAVSTTLSPGRPEFPPTPAGRRPRAPPHGASRPRGPARLGVPPAWRRRRRASARAA